MFFPSGQVCLSILNEQEGWRPVIRLQQVLLGIQELLDNPNVASAANPGVCLLLQKDPAAYEGRIRRTAAESALEEA